MLLNPKKAHNMQNMQAGSVEAQDPFDAPVPGQSLTDEPGKWAWEQAPEMVDVDEAVEYVVGSMMDDPEALEQIEKLMMTGMPIESIVNTISFAGFAEGKWTPDVAELIKPPLSAFFIILAKEENIPAVMFNTSDEETMPDSQVIAGMREGNPAAFEELQKQAIAADTPPPPPNNFLEMEEENLPVENENIDMGGIA